MKLRDKFLWAHLLFIGKLLLDELSIVQGIRKFRRTFITFLELNLNVRSKRNINDQIYMIARSQLNGEFVFKR
jgi:hypothetical protein